MGLSYLQVLASDWQWRGGKQEEVKHSVQFDNFSRFSNPTNIYGKPGMCKNNGAWC